MNAIYFLIVLAWVGLIIFNIVNFNITSVVFIAWSLLNIVYLLT